MTADAPVLPLVSVILPYYNGSGTVLRTLTSLAAQDYPEMEWIIVDDGSVEPLPQQAQELLRARDRSTVLRHEANLGLSRTLNDGLRAARGPLLLIIHQDIELVGADWVRRAVGYLKADERVAVVTCYYGIPAPEDLTFVKRSFGFLRRQFHRPVDYDWEYATFSEFKCDLARREDLGAIGDFPTRYRICGEDIVVSYALRQRGRRILKVHGLWCVQRFGGKAETVAGNLEKEFRFGESIAGVLLTFRGFSFRGLADSPYARRRSLHRATQPIVAALALLLLVAALITGSAVIVSCLVLLLVARMAYYVVRLWPEFRAALPKGTRAIAETFGASVLGLGSDFIYSLGVLVGALRKSLGAPL